MTYRAWAAAALAMALAACGGGGGDAGTSPFGSHDGSGAAPTSPGGGVSPTSSNRPTQRRFAMAAESYNLNWNVLGATTTIEVIVADTAGNPVPDGTRVQFSAEVGGTVQTSCVLSGATVDGSEISRCTVEFATIPSFSAAGDGIVEVIAWLVGEEAYVDLNGNGRYDPGEPFTDSGRIFRDDNHSQEYEFGFDELNLGETVNSAPGLGGAACEPPTHPQLIPVPSVPNTCDGAWGLTLIRQSIQMATSHFPSVGIALLGAPSTSGQLIVFSRPPWMFDDAFPIAAPAGTQVAFVSGPVGCSVTLGRDTIPPSSPGPTLIEYAATPACLGQDVIFSLTLDGQTINRTVEF